MSASLRSTVSTPVLRGVRQSATTPDHSTPPMQRPAAHDHQAGLNLDDVDGHAEQEALAVSPGQPSNQREHDVPGKHNKQPTPTGGAEQPSGRSTAPVSGVAARVRHSCPAPGSPCNPCGTGERAGRAVLAIPLERPSGPVVSGCWPRPRPRPGSRLGCRRGVAGLVAVCVLALGVAACSVRDAKAEASVSASASASAAIARAEKGIADANASATASREAALTPELRAKRDAALAEPAPAKPPQMNEESAEGAAASVGYFLDLYRYAFMTGNTTEFAAMSDDRCKFCKSTIDDANDIHSKGGWADKWDQEIVGMTYYEKLEGYEYNRVKVIVNYGAMASYYGDGQNPTTSDPSEGKVLNVAVRYSNKRWMIGTVEVEHK